MQMNALNDEVVAFYWRIDCFFLFQEHTSDRVIKGVPMLEDLGITPIPVDTQIPWELDPHRFDGSYEADYGEYPDIIPPKPVKSVRI